MWNIVKQKYGRNLNERDYSDRQTLSYPVSYLQYYYIVTKFWSQLRFVSHFSQTSRGAYTRRRFVTELAYKLQLSKIATKLKT